MTPDEFRALRMRCGLSLRQLSQVLKCSWVSIWRWESGRCPVPPQRAVQVSIMALHVARRTPYPCPHCGGTGVQRPA